MKLLFFIYFFARDHAFLTKIKIVKVRKNEKSSHPQGMAKITTGAYLKHFGWGVVLETELFTGQERKYSRSELARDSWKKQEPEALKACS